VTAPAVHAAINAVKKAVAKEGLAKGQRTQGGGDFSYPYRGIDAVMDTVADLMADAGLCIYPRTVDYKIDERRTEKTYQGTTKVSIQVCAYVTVEFDFVSAVDGSTHTCRFIGEAFDSGDKAVGKAESYAYRNCLIKVFVIPVNGKDEDTERDDPKPPLTTRETTRTQPHSTPQPRRAEEPKTEPAKPLPTRTSENYPVEQYAGVPFSSMPASALGAYIKHYEEKLLTIKVEHHAFAAKRSILAAQKELEARRAEEMKSGAASA
jgi:hypothetical protein